MMAWWPTRSSDSFVAIDVFQLGTYLTQIITPPQGDLSGYPFLAARYGLVTMYGLVTIKRTSGHCFVPLVLANGGSEK